MPTIALGIGVVVAGLGIGAFLSALHRDNVPQPAASTVARLTITPVPQASVDALALRTPVPHRTTTPAPSAAASASPAPSPSTTATSAATPSATPSSTPSPRASVKPTPSARPSSAASTRPSPRPSALAVTATAPPRPQAFGAQAETTVRRYLDALITGNDAGAYAAFGTAPGDPNVRLTEAAFVDRTSRIVSLRTTHADVTGATVEAEVTSAHGSYFVTYHVSRGQAGAVIDGHDYIRE